MPTVARKSRQIVEQSADALASIAKRFKLHKRLAREMHGDGYLKTRPEEIGYVLKSGEYNIEMQNLLTIAFNYSLSEHKILRMYNSGYIDLNGLDQQKAVSRYIQRHGGSLSVRLLCYVVYDEVSGGGLMKNQAVFDCLSALRINGKLNPPRDLQPDLDAAARGEKAALDRVARWMRDLIDSSDKPHGWAFFGVRLALIEGSYRLWTRDVPKLRKLPKVRKLAKLLREHPRLMDCVTPVKKTGQSGDVAYVYHRPGEFWDL
jgi:hypothetical protein